MDYFQIQEIVFNHLWDKHLKDKSFTFSVRQVAGKGAEKNHFIGTSKSNYFAFTCWDIPVYYPGSSGDLTGFIFMGKGQSYTLKFQYMMTKNATDDQSVADLEFGYKLRENLESANVPLWKNDEGSKMLYYHVQLANTAFGQADDLLKEWEKLYAMVASVVDNTINQIKSIHPQWQAGRFSKEKFESLISKMHQRIQKYANASLDEIEKLPEEDEIEPNDASFKSPYLNTILYGPPGTGKTYNSISRAAEIIEGKSFENRYDEAKEVYKKHIGDRIEFVTFHQNYSYEDFVTGLRPDIEIKNQLAFKERKGVFLRLCERAKENFELSKQTGSSTPAFDVLLKEFLEPLDAENGKITISTLGGRSKFELFDYDDTHIDYKRANKNDRRLRIDRIRDFYEGNILNVNGGPDDYHEAVSAKLKELAKQTTNTITPTTLVNFVLIIDEINRANISRVFGELITLIEEDKRLGNKHEMTITLSNGDKFSVPKNLFIVGTMNTADKSIALLDIALRRRFVFEAMYPKLDLVESPYKEFLQSLNEAILEKKGADFMIGHSYLMPDEIANTGFINIMNQKIIPLLNEYFYNNRSISVFDLLKDIIAKAGSYEVMVNPYKEVICQSKL